MLVLASASPRRQELLRNAGIPFSVHPAEIPENPLDGESPGACAERLAREKAETVSRLRPHDAVLAADTIVVVDGLMLAKPLDSDDAFRMLRMLSGRIHDVITGICLIGPGDSVPGSRFSVPSFVDVRSETTSVTVGEISDLEIRDYVASGEPMDKAGAYAIQGWASRWISRIEGDYFNVVGLPVSLVYRMLQDHNII